MKFRLSALAVIFIFYSLFLACAGVVSPKYRGLRVEEGLIFSWRVVNSHNNPIVPEMHWLSRSAGITALNSLPINPGDSMEFSLFSQSIKTEEETGRRFVMAILKAKDMEKLAYAKSKTVRIYSDSVAVFVFTADDFAWSMKVTR